MQRTAGPFHFLCLAEFAAAHGGEENQSVFRGSMNLAKNTFHGADCASEASAGSEVPSLLKSKPSEAGSI